MIVDRFVFAGRTCVITGAASGIGAALTLDLARRGAVLALVDRDAEGLARVAGQARESGAKQVSTHVVDLSDGGDRLDLAAEVAARHGGADLLINNAGVALTGTFDEVSMDDFDWLMEINLHAVIRMTKAFLPQLMSRPGAHVVNISSLFGLIAPPTQVAYVTSKYGVRGFSEALRHELAGTVGVTVVHPGGIRTNIATSARLTVADPDGSQAARAADFTRTSLTMPPEEAAKLIIAAVRTRKPRLVITWVARMADVLARVAPGRYWNVLQRQAAKRTV